jgi:nucleotide-binding universal stress UspA family protein
MYKKILVPHAGTAGGDKALKHAIHIAKFDSSEILLLNVEEEAGTEIRSQTKRNETQE